MFRRDWMGESVRDHQRHFPNDTWTVFIANAYKNPRIRKGFNDAEDEHRRRGDPTYL